LDVWIKNAPQKFYWIEYAWEEREHPKRGEFIPDFFVMMDDMIYVVEIKDDGEITEPALENQKKCGQVRLDGRKRTAVRWRQARVGDPLDTVRKLCQNCMELREKGFHD
jgi:hypothetical protein